MALQVTRCKGIASLANKTLRGGVGIRCYSAAVSHEPVREHAKPTTKLLIDGQFIESQTKEWIPLYNPATNEVIGNVPKATQAEMDAAANAAAKAFPKWANTSIMARQQIMFRFQSLIKDNMDKLAANVTLEQGKTIPDSEGDVMRGLQVVEHSCSVTSLQLGETLPSITKDMDTHSYRVPIGVCAGVCPFNFPAMIPLWMFPLALACGNTFVLKPSEQDPGAAMMLAELAQQAGVPDGVLNIIHGGKESVDFVCDNPHIKAISFVGSDFVGQYIYERGSMNGKRVQSNMVSAAMKSQKYDVYMHLEHDNGDANLAKCSCKA
eukprot:Seg1348.11 transcript_id=Seg1348.11/GoldUCD/mRNA.D3Y31 product="Methylmalonate-semialdehyde dehydrogenase" protein_id=Seg1348.11/GoldUCD/D3Y31